MAVRSQLSHLFGYARKDSVMAFGIVARVLCLRKRIIPKVVWGRRKREGREDSRSPGQL